MKYERWEQIEHLYHAALEQDPETRAAFLDQACADDEALRHEVESLLAYDDEPADFIESPVLEVAARQLDLQSFAESQTQPPTKTSVPSQLGFYQILSPLGRGGMGEVYLAQDTRLDRKVAIKLLPANFLTDAERVRRFAQESRAVSALNHPNIITIHEIGEASAENAGTRYLVTEYIEGETLRQKMTTAPGQRIEASEATEIALQVTAALSAAHEAGITHRDIKPENVMVRRDGIVKVLDFGLAKLTEPSLHPHHALAATITGVSTLAGMVMGTPRYMSPEQASGEKVDARTDIFSLGVMLYEMIAGHAPFEGETPSKIIAAILRDEPPPLADGTPETPSELERIINKALRKNREERYQAAAELSADLKRLKRQMEAEDASANEFLARSGSLLPTQHKAKFLLRGLLQPKLIGVFALVLVVAGMGWLYWRSVKLKKARAALVQIEKLAQGERFFEAYDLAIEAQPYLPNDPTLMRLMRTIADDLTVVSDPPGAQVYLKRFLPDESGGKQARPARQLIGVTPINHQQIARGGYIIYIEKEGYASHERSVTGFMMQTAGLSAPTRPISLEAKLIEAAKIPPRMVFVPGGDYRLANWGRPTDKSVRLGDYFIDKYEVTNREYKDFISAGGYLKREFWRYPVVRNGRELAWEDAIREFKDRTSLPGPRSWTNQDFPEAQAEHPVTDISWYEAAAYAAFRGKELPTVFQWEKAARSARLGGTNYYMMPWGAFTGTIEQRANFNGRGTMPVDSLEFGQSPYGCYHMAGNVSEWGRNQSPEGFTVMGASWEDPAYIFGNYGPYPSFYSSGKLGFRCVLKAPGVTGDQGAMPLFAKTEVPVYTPISDVSFRALQENYRYAQPPLDAQIVEIAETDDWRREKITYVGAEGQRAIAYLYLPKNYPPPWQVIQFVPGDDVFDRFRSLPVRVEGSLTPFIKSGRAVLAVVLQGFLEREWPSNRTPPLVETAEFRDQVLNWTADERRGVDYIATRSDLDSSRVVYYGVSIGDSRKLVPPAVEARYRSVILIGGGLRQNFTRVMPEINPVNLLPQIRAPKLILHGRYDENLPLKSQAEPLQKLLRGTKRIILYDGGHVPPPEIYVAPINNWLDETLGPVRRK